MTPEEADFFRRLELALSRAAEMYPLALDFWQRYAAAHSKPDDKGDKSQ